MGLSFLGDYLLFCPAFPDVYSKVDKRTAILIAFWSALLGLPESCRLLRFLL